MAASSVDPTQPAAQRKEEEEDEGAKGGGETDGEKDAVCSDQELDDLLDFSLGEFGKHLPSANTTTSDPQPEHPQPPSGSGRGSGRGKEGVGGGDDAPTASTMQDFEDVFSEEFVAQAQAKLDEAMKVLSKEDPQLWEQLKGFSDAASASLRAGGKEGEGEEEGEGEGEGGEGGGGSIEETLEDTLRRLKESTEKIEAEGGLGGMEAGLPDGLMKLMEEMKGAGEEGDGEDGEEGLVKMMDKMMSSFLFSRDVLHPFLTQTCKQYAEWLPGQRGKLSAEDFSRYGKQLEVMREMCREFEGQSEEGEGEEERGASGGAGRGGEEESKQNERIIELMHQLQQYGQPPPDIIGDGHMQPPPLLPGGPIPTDCSLM